MSQYVSILTTEDPAPLRSRAIRRLVFLANFEVAAPRRVSNHDSGSADPADSMKKAVKKTYALLKASWLWQVLQVSVPQDVVAI